MFGWVSLLHRLLSSPAAPIFVDLSPIRISGVTRDPQKPNPTQTPADSLAIFWTSTPEEVVKVSGDSTK